MHFKKEIHYYDYIVILFNHRNVQHLSAFTVCVCICPLNHYRRCKTVPATNLEKSTNLGEVCGKCHVTSPLPHTELELEMPRVTIWLWLSFAAIFIVYQPTNVHWYNIFTNGGEFVMKKQVGPTIQLLR